jgi:maltokinase
MTLSTDPTALALGRHGIADSADAIRAWLQRARWFGGREREVQRVELEDIGVLREADPLVLYTLWRVDYADGPAELYSLPLGVRPAPHPVARLGPERLIHGGAGAEHKLLVYDALADPEAALELWRLVATEAARPTFAGRLLSRRLVDVEMAGIDPPHLLGVQQSNSALARGQHDFLKWTRRIETGPNAELEMVEALGARRFPHTPALHGHISYQRSGEPLALQAILQAFLHNGTEGWAMALTSLRDLYGAAEEAELTSPRERHLLVDEHGASFEAEAARLGDVTAQLHLALADPALPAPLTPIRAGPAELDRWAAEMTAELDDLLRSTNPSIAPLAAKRDVVASRFAALRHLEDGGLAIRAHGDYHLGQVLRTDEGWKIIDFGGEPTRAAPQRRELTSPLRDVAGMLRSFDYAAAAALAERMPPSDPLWARLAPAGHAWAKVNRDAFWAAYLERVAGTGLLPDAGAALTLRVAFELAKAVYEVAYELGHRPDWAGIPLDFLLAGVP